MTWSHHEVDRRAVEVHKLDGSASLSIVLVETRDPLNDCDACGQNFWPFGERMYPLRSCAGKGQDIKRHGYACHDCVMYIANGECSPEGSCCRK